MPAVKVVITGGTGFIGVRLAQRLLDRSEPAGASAVEPVEEIVLFDAVEPDGLPAPLAGRVSVVAGDVADPAVAARVIDRRGCSVFHLAAVLSAGGERDFDHALRVNLDGSRAVLEACRAVGGCRLVATSTYAAYGGPALPDPVTDATRLTPETTYGATKAVLELLVSDYARKGYVDGRSARLPTVIVRPGSPNAAASSWVSGVVREPLAGEPCVLPVGLDLRTAVGGVRSVVEGILALHDLPGEALGADRSVLFPSLSVTAGELAECARRVGAEAGRRVGSVDVRPDSVVEAICGSWPKRVEAARARELGIPADDTVDAVVREYVEDYL
jgi:nucleoside-diphosphate-sugar epimerase